MTSTSYPFTDQWWTHRNGATPNELQGYQTLGNTAVDDGCLTITAQAQPYVAHWPTDSNRDYTSARLDTKGKLDIAPGSYVEMAVSLNVVKGGWPAFWLVGADEAQVGWPSCGEIDVLEVVGGVDDYGFLTARRTLHQDAADGSRRDVRVGWDGLHATTLVSYGRVQAYGVHFDGNGVRWYIDRALVLTVTREQVEAAGGVWRYGKPMNVIVNLAVGGAGNAPDPANFPQSVTFGPLLVIDPPGYVPQP